MPAAVPMVVAVGRVVRVAVEGPFEQEHHEESRQHPHHRGVDLPVELEKGVREEVQEADAEQNAPGQREQHLHPAMPHGKK